MGVMETVALALSALTGGIVGAASAAYLAGLRVGANMEGFRAAYRAYMDGRTDEPSLMLNAAFEELDAAWRTFGSALARLGHAAKIRK
jgi:hypothetical protein